MEVVVVVAAWTSESEIVTIKVIVMTLVMEKKPRLN